MYRVVVTVQQQFADTNLSLMQTGREISLSTVRELLSRPDYDPIHTLSDSVSANGKETARESGRVPVEG